MMNAADIALTAACHVYIDEDVGSGVVTLDAASLTGGVDSHSYPNMVL
jgi:hypothetical protein